MKNNTLTPFKSKFWKIGVILSGILLFGSPIFAQITNVDMSPAVTGQTFNTCAAALHDSGGTSAAGYTNNENVIITICPDTPGDAITIDFITFALSTVNTATPPASNIDNLTIYDGNSTSATTLGTYTGTSLSGLLVSCTSFNTSGCLTLEFHSNSAGTGVFAGSITCTTPCQRPVAVLDSPIIPAPDTCLKICIGESVTFDGTSSYAAPGFNIDQYKWDFGDGTIDTTSGPVVTHTFTTPGEHRVDLFLFDDNDCASTNRVTVQVLVGTVPTFDGTTSDTSICLGESICINGVVNGTQYTGLPYNNLGGATYLPDDVGMCFTSTIDFNVFSPGATLTNINWLFGINVNMEHSFMGDLVATIYCPDGTSVIMHQQLGGGTFLGEPVDLSGPADPPGVGYDYTWSPSATNGTWVDNAIGGVTPSLVTVPGGGQALAPGTYESLNPLTGLLGCPLNGTWTLEFCDLWGADDGWVFDWSIDFDPVLFPDITEFTPVYGADCDSTFWTPDNAASAAQVTSTNATCDQICITPNALGTYSYTYTAIDDFGCSYTTTTTIEVTPGPVVDAGADIIVCPGIPGTLDATVPDAGGDCDYVIDMHDSFGDGWNGASIDFDISGVGSTNYTMLSGSDISFTVTVPAGSTFDMYYNPGSWESEVTYEVYDCDGNLVFSDGTFPATGLVFSGSAGADIVYSWSPTTGLSDPTIEDPTVTVSSQTTYYLTVYENGHPLCGSVDSVTVFINALVDAGIDGTLDLCYYDPPADMFPSIGGTPALTGSWFDASGNPITNMYDPSTMASGDYLYIVPAAGGCPADTSIVTVTEYAPGDPNCCIVNFTYDSTNISCSGGCDGVIDISTSEGVLFSFDGGATFGADSVATGLCAGTYTVIVQAASGCQTTQIITLTEPTPLSVSIDVISNVLCFGGGDGQLEANPTGGTAPYTYLWDDPCAQTTAIAGTVACPLTAGTYCVTVTDNMGCTFQRCTTIVEPPLLTLQLNTTNVICFGQCNGTAEAVVGGGAGGYNFNWGGIADSGASSATNICAGFYNLIVTDANGCTVDTLNWEIAQPLEVILSSADPVKETCYGMCDGSITIVSTNATQFSIDNGVTFGTNPVFTDLCPGTYTIVITDNNGCSETTTAIVDGNAAVVPGFSFTPIPATIMNPLITFNNLSINASTYIWNFDGLGTSVEINPQFEFPQDSAGVYNVCLTAINGAGCDSTICFDVYIDDIFTIYVPNTFTPDGNGINDMFIISGNDIDPTDFEIMIFDRWGERIFQSNDLNKGWDGTHKGIKCKSDTYVWKIHAKSLESGAHYNNMGHVNLLR